MAISFDNTFRNQKYPKEIIEYLQKKVPDNTEYIYNENNSFSLKAKDGKLIISGFKYEPFGEDAKVLEGLSSEEVLFYLINKQEPFELSLEKPGYVIVNGKEMKEVDVANKNPLNQIQFSNSKVFVYPPRFEPFIVDAYIDNKKYSISMKRIANNSPYIEKYESDEGALKVNYEINIKTGIMRINVSVDVANAKSIDNIIKSFTIYNAIVMNELCVSGKKLTYSNNVDNSKRIEKDIVVFWEKVGKIEKTIGVLFRGPFNNCDENVVNMVEEIYQSIVNKKAIKTSNKIKSIKGNFVDFKDNINECIGKDLLFCFEMEKEYLLFGETIVLPGIECISHARIDKCIPLDQEYELFFNNTNASFSIIRVFCNKKELKLFRDNDDYVEELCKSIL